MKDMKTITMEELQKRLLFLTARSRHMILKELWTLTGSKRPGTRKEFDELSKELASHALTEMRHEVHQLLTSNEMKEEFPVIHEVQEDEMPEVKRNIMIMAGIGFDEECIAELNCVSKGYVRMTVRSLGNDFPELFR